MVITGHSVFHLLMPSMPHTVLPLNSQHHHSSDACHPHSNCMASAGPGFMGWYSSPQTHHLLFPREQGLTTEETLPGHGQAAGWTEGSWGAVWPHKRSPPCPFCSEHRQCSVLLLLSQAGGTHWCSSLALLSALLTPGGCKGTSPSNTGKNKRDVMRRTQKLRVLMKGRWRSLWAGLPVTFMINEAPKRLAQGTQSISLKSTANRKQTVQMLESGSGKDHNKRMALPPLQGKNRVRQDK